MTAAQPTIIATSINFRRSAAGGLWDGDAGPAYDYAAKLARAGRHPRICVLATGVGDNPMNITAYYGAFGRRDMLVTHLALFPMPSIAGIREHLLAQDIIWVAGGSTSNLLAVWRVHGLDAILAECWAAGVVLMGVSAGSICWHAGGTTDSFGPLRAVTDGLGFLPYSNSPHYDVEPGRRPLFQRLVGEGVLPDGFATDNGTGLVFFGTELHEAITEVAGASAYEVRSGPGGVTEKAVPVRQL